MEESTVSSRPLLSVTSIKERDCTQASICKKKFKFGRLKKVAVNTVLVLERTESYILGSSVARLRNTLMLPKAQYHNFCTTVLLCGYVHVFGG